MGKRDVYPAFKMGWSSLVIDLTRDEAALHADLRKSYRNLINRGQREYQIITDHQSILTGEYAALHRASVGIIAPRPDTTYLMQGQWVQDKRAFIVGACEPTRWVAFCYVIVYKHAAYYASGPSLVPSAMHAVLWRAILEAKALGCTRFEVGWVGHATTEKDKQIEFFKRGFGGVECPVWVMEVTP